MPIRLEYQKSKPSKTRKLPYLPRIGVVVDFAHWTVTYKQTPILETAANLVNEHVNIPKILQVVEKQFSEIKFPKGLKKSQVINTTARVLKSSLSKDS